MKDNYSYLHKSDHSYEPMLKSVNYSSGTIKCFHIKCLCLLSHTTPGPEVILIEKKCCGAENKSSRVL